MIRFPAVTFTPNAPGLQDAPAAQPATKFSASCTRVMVACAAQLKLSVLNRAAKLHSSGRNDARVIRGSLRNHCSGGQALGYARLRGEVVACGRGGAADDGGGARAAVSARAVNQRDVVRAGGE